VRRNLGKHSWAATLRISGSSASGEPLYDLDSFTDASLQEWTAYGRAVRDFNYALFFDLAGQRAARHKELRTALQQVAPTTVSLDGWCRLVNFQYSMNVLSPAGSLRWVGQRFNVGVDIDPVSFPPFPALYVAENFETAFREYHQMAKGAKVDGLRPEELSLEDRGNWVSVQLGGHINNVFDLTRVANLKELCRILSRFDLSDRVKNLAIKARRSPASIIKTPADLLSTFLRPDWKAWPVHFDVLANSQVFAQMLVEAGFEGVLYRSARGADRCLAIFTRQLGNSDSHITVRGECPAGARMLELDATNCLEV